jgi:hypothetical protein
MCLTTAYLAAFLNIVGAENVSTEPGRIVVHAQTRDAHWVAYDDEHWCTMAPQIDRMRLRLAAGRD